MKTQMYIVGQHVWPKAYPNHKGIIVEAAAPDNRSRNPIYKVVYDDMPILNGWYNHNELLTTGPKHKHADLMLQYANESFTDAEAYKQWQFSRDSGDTWVQCEQAPVWATSVMYRRKPAITYKPTKEKIEFVKPVKNVNDLIGIDVLFLIQSRVNSNTLNTTSDIIELKIHNMSPYDINHVIQNNAAFTTKEHAVVFMDAYDKMKQYMR